MSRIADELREWAAAQCNSLALYNLADRIRRLAEREEKR